MGIGITPITDKSTDIKDKIKSNEASHNVFQNCHLMKGQVIDVSFNPYHHC